MTKSNPDFFRADLHCHSCHSDGHFTPEALIEMAIKAGLSGLSITDHDTISAYAEALPMAKESGLLLLPGVEISTVFQGRGIHVLAYGFSYPNPFLENFFKERLQGRMNRNRRIFSYLKDRGIELDKESPLLQGKHVLGRLHIAKAMVEAKHVLTIQQAFNDYLSSPSCQYRNEESISTEKAIEAIHQAGGLAILAHPHLIRDKSIVSGLLKLPLDGLESYYSRMPRENHDKWLEIVEKKQWIATGGSDFHGGPSPKAPLGSSWIGEETFMHLFQRQHPASS